MAESKRERHHTSERKVDEDVQQRHDLFTMVAFLLGGVAVVSGMLWLADGLSDNFNFTSTAFIVFVGLGGVALVIGLVNSLMYRRATR